jgi:hypothetical protein
MKPSFVAASLNRIASNILSSRNPSKKLVAKDLRRILAAMNSDTLESKVWQFLYGKTAPSVPSDLEGTYSASSLYWEAFNKIGVVDWSPVTDPKPVFEAAKKITEEAIKNGKMNEEQASNSLDIVKANWEDYKKYYMQEDIKKLVSAGVITADEVIN